MYKSAIENVKLSNDDNCKRFESPVLLLPKLAHSSSNVDKRGCDDTFGRQILSSVHDDHKKDTSPGDTHCTGIEDLSGNYKKKDHIVPEQISPPHEHAMCDKHNGKHLDIDDKDESVTNEKIDHMKTQQMSNVETDEKNSTTYNTAKMTRRHSSSAILQNLASFKTLLKERSSAVEHLTAEDEHADQLHEVPIRKSSTSKLQRGHLPAMPLLPAVEYRNKPCALNNQYVPKDGVFPSRRASMVYRNKPEQDSDSFLIKAADDEVHLWNSSSNYNVRATFPPSALGENAIIPKRRASIAGLGHRGYQRPDTLLRSTSTTNMAGISTNAHDSYSDSKTVPLQLGRLRAHCPSSQYSRGPVDGAMKSATETRFTSTCRGVPSNSERRVYARTPAARLRMHMAELAEHRTTAEQMNVEAGHKKILERRQSLGKHS